jgi:hypothetical protein
MGREMFHEVSLERPYGDLSSVGTKKRVVRTCQWFVKVKMRRRVGKAKSLTEELPQCFIHIRNFFAPSLP